MFKQIGISSEPKVIGVTNGLYQVKIDEKNLKNNPNYTQIERFFNEIDVWEFLRVQEQIFQLKIKCLTGKLLKKAKPTDIMGFSPFIFGFKYIVSQNFVDCLINEMVESNEFHLFKIDVKGLDLDYYLFFVPMIPSSEIDFSKSLLFPEKDLLTGNRRYFDVANHGQYRELLKSNAFIRWEKIVISKKYQNNGIINLQGTSELFFSNSLVEKLLSQSLTNLVVKDNIELFVAGS